MPADASTVVLSTSASTCKLYVRRTDTVPLTGGYFAVNSISNYNNGTFGHNFYIPGMQLDTRNASVSIFCDLPSNAIVEQYRYFDSYTSFDE
jgi:hypothetical protein